MPTFAVLAAAAALAAASPAPATASPALVASAPVTAAADPSVATPQTPAAQAEADLAKVFDPIGDMIQAAGGEINNAAQAAEIQVKATLYHAAERGMSKRDSLGCKLVPMRTVAVDPAVTPRHTVLFIKETVGMILPDGSVHDGFWYASDVGRAIKGLKVDLFTGMNAHSMKAFQTLNNAVLNAVKVGTFSGCPTTRSPAPAAGTQLAAAN